jgi:hypothetical protein
MMVFLFIIGTKMLTCLGGAGCHDIIGVPEVVIAVGGFELVGEFFGFTVYRKIINKKDKE